MPSLYNPLPNSAAICAARHVTPCVCASPKTVELGGHKLLFPGPELKPLRISNDLLDKQDFAGLRERLESEGYLHLKGLLDREKVFAARLFVLENFNQRGGILDPDRALSDGILLETCGVSCVPFMEGKNDITHSAEVLNGALESSEISSFFEGLFDSKVRTFDFKWLRGVPQGAFTGAHVDWVYMGRGTERLLTCWIPIGDNPTEMGTIAVLEGSHKEEGGFKKFQETYGKLDTEAANLDGSGWFCTNPREVGRFGGVWRTADFDAGDIILFTMHTVHMSTTNTSSKVRISADVRWQPESEPSDPRYVGNFKVEDRVKSGLLRKDEEAETEKEERQNKVTIGVLKREWGLLDTNFAESK